MKISSDEASAAVSAFKTRFPLISLPSESRAEIEEQFNEDGLRFLELKEKDQLIDSNHPRFLDGLHLPSTRQEIGIIFGFGLGDFAELSIRTDACRHWIIIEPSTQRLHRALQVQESSSLIQNERVHFMVGERVADYFAPFFHFLSDREILPKAFSVHWISHPVIEALYPNFLPALKKQWAAAAETVRNMQSTADDGFEGFRNSVANKRWIEESHGLTELEGLYQGKVGIVVSTGPSLTRSLPYLKEIQSRVILLAADASLKILIEHEIEPQFVFCLERDEGSKPFFERLAPGRKRSCLVSFPLVPRTVIEAFSGPSICVYRNYGYSLDFERECPRGIIRCGPSVAHMALVVGCRLGLRQLALIGQDLSFDPKTLASHPEGIAYDGWSDTQSLEQLKDKLKSQNDTLLMVPGNIEAEVPTSGTYEIFRQLFSEHQHNLGVPVVNITMGGAAIAGIPWRPCEDFISELMKTEPVDSALFDKRDRILQRPVPKHSLTLKNLRNQLLEWRELVKIDGSVDDLIQAKNTLEDREGFRVTLFHFFGRDRIDLEWQLNQDPSNQKLLQQWHEKVRELIDRCLSYLALI